MAASDTTYRNTKGLHIVFAVTSLVMLVTVMWMFADDFYRPWKVEQRVFRDVETEMAKRALLAATPSEEKVQQIVAIEQELAEKKADVARLKSEVERELGSDFLPKKLKAENKKAGIKADIDSVKIFYNKHEQEDPLAAHAPETLSE